MVDFCGDERDLGRSGHLTFGRSGDLAIDDDPYLHRVVGEFRAAAGHWWLRSSGGRTPLRVVERSGLLAAELRPGAEVALAPGEYGVGFTSGPTAYELDVLVEGAAEEGPDRGTGAHDIGSGAALVALLEERTLEWGRVDLNDEQHLLLVALAAPTLRGIPGAPVEVPTNRSVASALGWTVTKLNRKLDHLCRKLARAGVSGLHGDVAALAADRRRRLVEHACAVGLVEPAHLGLLDGPTLSATPAAPTGGPASLGPG